MKYTKLILDERMIVPEPKIRLEFFLHAIVTGETCELKPKTVDEEYLYAIATSDTSRMGEIYPRTLVEIYYDAILNNSVEDLPTPRTRWEEFLRSAVTKEPCGLEPETSLEIYLSQISSNGGFDYIVSTSTNSTIISLPNSTNGTIKSIEMDGNTLVNYCTNGSEELTLNNEINVQGVNITLTDTVDNSKVDVVCEGNTLVNLFSGTKTVGTNLINFKLSYIPKKNTLYTVIFNISYQTSTGEFPWGGFLNKDSSVWRGQFSKNNMKQGLNMAKVTTQDSDDLGSVFRFGWNSTVVSNVEINNLIILEGDYTNKPIPSYFEGMKSVGECEDNKIEILSSSINTDGLSTYIDCSKHKSGDTVLVDLSGNGNDFILNKPSEFNNGALILDGSNYATLSNPDVFKAKNTGTFMKFKVKNDSPTYSHLLCKQINAITLDGVNRFRLYPIREHDTTMPAINREVEHTLYVGDNFVMVDGIFYDKNYINAQDGDNLTYLGSYIGRENLIGEIYCLLIYNRNLSKEEVGALNSSFAHKSNKKEIQLSEPLRGLPNGIKDKFIKQGGKWYVERNCGEYTFTGNEGLFYDPSNFSSYNFYTSNIVNKAPYYHENGYLCNTLKTIAYDYSREYSGKNIGSNFAYGFNFAIGKNEFGEDKTISEVEVLFKQWLSENPTTVVYQLATPTYEEIIDPQLITYLNITRISTNSTIPCNMQITNSGYSAIIKPSTQYTVAFDANASGEVNIGLGGAKTSTTNNVATITTPSTLTDDSLMLYGKGIKASNVRLLEGNKTNYIPSFFEGMKSCFEDKEQGDNTYEVEISSNSKNLFDISKVNPKFTVNNGTITGTTVGYNNSLFTGKSGIAISDTSKVLKLKAGTYILSKTGVALTISYRPINSSTTSSLSTSGSYGRFTLSEDSYVDIKVYASNKDFEVSNIQIEKGSEATGYVPYKSNKIQLQLNEPLRSLPNGVKDKFIFKDGKLMIERNTSKSKVNNIENVSKSYEGWNNIVFAYKVEDLISAGVSIRNVWSNLLPSRDVADLCNTLGKTGIASHNWGDGKLQIAISGIDTVEKMKEWVSKNDLEIVYQIEPTYEEVPTSQRLTCYENATLFIDTNIAPTHVEIEYPTEKQQLFRIK